MGNQDGSERRKHRRAPIVLVVRLRFSSIDQFLEAHARDISKGGLFIEGEQETASGAAREIGQLLSVQFNVGAEHLVEGVARVVRVVPPGSLSAMPGIGVEFLNLDELSAELIESIVRNTLGV